MRRICPLLLILATVSAALAQGADVTRFAGATLPQPPQQTAAWTPPPTTLPSTFVSATTVLFDQGLADPRGCTYQEVHIVTGTVWGGDEPFKTHAWVLPAVTGDAQRFAVCWNGLVYPVVSLGAAADFKADARALIQADQKQRDDFAASFPGRSFSRFHQAIAESFTVSPETVLPIKASLLLRLGDADLAQQAWAAWTAGLQRANSNDARDLDDPYLMLATDWTWSIFDRLICAHMRGDDRLALIAAQALDAIAPAVEAEAARRKFPPRNDGRPGKALYLDFLRPLPLLLADQQRRAAKPSAPRAATTQPTIAWLIDDLDQVAAHQMGQPGGVNLGEDSIVQSLIARGDDAVEPLLACLETDTRLTRSVHFWRDFARYRDPIGVHEAAYVALCGILQTSFFSVGSTGDDLTAHGMEGRRAVADAIRAYWTKYKGMSAPQRWYTILADDTSSPAQWLQSADNIVRPVDVRQTPGSMFGASWIITPVRRPGEKPALGGESLRARRDPSVTDLLTRRIQQLAAGGADARAAVNDATSLILALSAWDPPAALPAARAQIALCRSGVASMPAGGGGWLRQDDSRAIINLARMLIAAGDRQALADYAAWMARQSPADLQFTVRDALELLWTNPDDPAVAKATQSMFNDPQSPWNPILPAKGANGTGYVIEMLDTPLVGLPAVQNQLYADLADESDAGAVTVAANGKASYKTGGITIGCEMRGDPAAPKGPATFTVRTCDVYAHDLSALPGMPRCELYWPPEKRRDAVAACLAQLHRYGARFRCVPNQTYIPSFGRAAINFPKLDHPATAQDVRDGLAIFSLAGAESVRRCPAPALPATARWTAYQNAVSIGSTWDPETRKSKEVMLYNQDGVVCQAEEALEQGQWRRYYGFVGRFVLAKAPADEIEFPASGFWRQLSGGLDAEFVQPGETAGKTTVAVTRLSAADALVVTVNLRNRAGIDQAVPALWYRKDPAAPALRRGIELKLSYTAQAPAYQGRAWDFPRPPDKTPWEPLAPKPITRFVDPQTKILAPTQETQALRVDLHDLFTVTRGGWYRLQILWDEKDGAPATGSCRDVVFSLAAPPQAH